MVGCSVALNTGDQDKATFPVCSRCNLRCVSHYSFCKTRHTFAVCTSKSNSFAVPQEHGSGSRRYELEWHWTTCRVRRDNTLSTELKWNAKYQRLWCQHQPSVKLERLTGSSTQVSSSRLYSIRSLWNKCQVTMKEARILHFLNL